MKMQLTKDEVKFIDTYLRNSGVNYIDIRIEMLDHVASEIEAVLSHKNISFYAAFKDYMAIHKKELLKRNEQLYRKAAARKVWSHFKVKLFSFFSLSVFGIIFFSFSILNRILLPEQFQNVLDMFPLVVIGGAIVYYAISFRRVGKRYSVFETLGLCFIVIHFFYNLFSNKKLVSTPITEDAFLLAKFIWSVWGLLVVLLLCVAFELKQHYKFKFEN